jgi:TrmH family RNA methyltransferase
MISKSKSKFIKSLQVKKYRKQEQCFVVEGTKSILEVFDSDYEILLLAATEDFLQEHGGRIPRHVEVMTASLDELKALGEYQTNDSGLAVVRMKPNHAIVVADDEFVLMLDDVRDPGNLGTIIRTADWYGIHKIIVSTESVDVYGGKVINASMGSFTRMQIYYTDLVAFLNQYNLPVYGTLLDGENIHEINFGSGGFIVMGNEANGISAKVEKLITKRITIPKFGHAESLNAAIATGVVLDNLRRQK